MRVPWVTKVATLSARLLNFWDLFSDLTVAAALHASGVYWAFYLAVASVLLPYVVMTLLLHHVFSKQLSTKLSAEAARGPYTVLYLLLALPGFLIIEVYLLLFRPFDNLEGTVTLQYIHRVRKLVVVLFEDVPMLCLTLYLVLNGQRTVKFELLILSALASLASLVQQTLFISEAARLNQISRLQYIRMTLMAGFGFVPHLDPVRRGAITSADYSKHTLDEDALHTVLSAVSINNDTHVHTPLRTLVLTGSEEACLTTAWPAPCVALNKIVLGKRCAARTDTGAPRTWSTRNLLRLSTFARQVDLSSPRLQAQHDSPAAFVLGGHARGLLPSLKHLTLWELLEGDMRQLRKQKLWLESLVLLSPEPAPGLATRLGAYASKRLKKLQIGSAALTLASIELDLQPVGSPRFASPFMRTRSLAATKESREPRAKTWEQCHKRACLEAPRVLGVHSVACLFGVLRWVEQVEPIVLQLDSVAALEVVLHGLGPSSSIKELTLTLTADCDLSSFSSVLATALQANTSLTSLSLQGEQLSLDVAALQEVVMALHAHPKLTRFVLCGGGMGQAEGIMLQRWLCAFVPRFLQWLLAEQGALEELAVGPMAKVDGGGGSSGGGGDSRGGGPLRELLATDYWANTEQLRGKPLRVWGCLEDFLQVQLAQDLALS